MFREEEEINTLALIARQFGIACCAAIVCASFGVVFAPLAAHAQAEPPTLPTVVSANDPAIRYVGRFDFRDSVGPRCSWSASTVRIRFEGDALNAVINEQGDNRWQIEIDGKPTTVLSPQKGEHRYAVASGLPTSLHTVSLVKATEGFVGITQFVRF